MSEPERPRIDHSRIGEWPEPKPLKNYHGPIIVRYSDGIVEFRMNPPTWMSDEAFQALRRKASERDGIQHDDAEQLDHPCPYAERGFP